MALLKKKAGRLFVRIEAMRSEDGQECHAVVMDITDHKRTEEALHTAATQAESEKHRLEAVLEALPLGVVITDATGGIVRSNNMIKDLGAAAGNTSRRRLYRIQSMVG